MTLIQCVAGDDWSCKRRFSLVARAKELKGLRFDNNGTHGADVVWDTI